MRFITKLLQRLEGIDSALCVGLDSTYTKIPEFLKKETILDTVFEFNKNIIEVTHPVAAAYKCNVAFYAGFGIEGLQALEKTNKFLEEQYPEIPRIADCKRSEMGESMEMVKKEIFDWLGFDCVMVTPWFGFDTIKNYLADESHGVSVYVHDSNPTAIEIQDLELLHGKKVYEVVAEKVKNEWNTNGNVFAEAGLTYPTELHRIREIIGDDMPLLVAGLGAQGGKLEDLKGLFGKNNKRLLVNSSRGIIFGSSKTSEEEYFQETKEIAERLAAEIAKQA